METIIGIILAVPMAIVYLLETIHEKRNNMYRLERDLFYTPTEYKPKHIPSHIHNCINCGAPLRKDQHKCEYCGTEYW